MDFIDVLRQHSSLVEKLIPKLQNEEQTKTSLIMPFFQQVLGYNVFDPDEFVPEFTADVGIKKGEKVDYAIYIDGKPTILIEAKWCGEQLGKHDSQLFRYFGTTTAKFGILTNGIIYRFYTDLDDKNKMDLKPFLEVDLLNLKDTLVPELKRFCKTSFNSDEMFDRASELKYSNEIKNYFTEQLDNPSDEFVKFFCSKVYDGVKTAQKIEEFRAIVQTSLKNLIKEMMNERISKALGNTAPEPAPSPQEAPAESAPIAEEKSGVVTTEEELQAFYIVKAILASEVDISNITYKDTVNYFSVLWNNMPTKWICRLRIKEKKSYISFPSTEEPGKEIYNEFAALDDIYSHRDAIIAAAKRFIL